jgi:ribosomal protein S18 acetylase RimI-like enzyme
MYEIWVDKAVDEKYQVIVSQKGSKVIGFIASRPEEDEYHIELVAVDREHRGRGIGEGLLNYALRGAKHHFSRASIAVQLGNISALRLYEKIGFRIRASEATFHWWRKQTGK